MKRAVIGLGSNLGDRMQTLRAAVAELGGHPDVTVLRVSRLFETEPIGGPAQGDYLNGVVLAATSLSPAELLAFLHDVELNHGREHHERWGPRTLDLDLVDFEDFVSDLPELTVPHPRAVEREFVLRPLADVDSTWRLLGNTVALRLADIETTADRPTVAITDFGTEWWR